MPNISSSLREAQEAEFGRLLIREIPAMHITVSRRLGDSLETPEEQWAETKGAYEKVKDSYRKMLEQICDTDYDSCKNQPPEVETAEHKQ